MPMDGQLSRESGMTPHTAIFGTAVHSGDRTSGVKSQKSLPKAPARLEPTTTGEVHWQERLGPHHSSSLVAANGHVYFLDDEGTTHVVAADKEFKVVAKNPLGEEAYSSPAISDGQLFIRGAKHLIAIGR